MSPPDEDELLLDIDDEDSVTLVVDDMLELDCDELSISVDGLEEDSEDELSPSNPRYTQ